MKQINANQAYSSSCFIYRKIYYKILLMSAFAVSACLLHAQNNSDGKWTGSFFHPRDTTATALELVLENGKLLAINTNSIDTWFSKAKLVQKTNGNSILFWWTNSGDLGIQSFIYKFTAVTTDSAEISSWNKTSFHYDKVTKQNGWKLDGFGYVLKVSPLPAIARRN